jgi:hypothetical protein
MSEEFGEEDFPAVVPPEVLPMTEEGCECEKERHIKKIAEAVEAEANQVENETLKANPETRVILEVTKTVMPTEAVEGEEQELDNVEGDPVGEGTG